MFSAEKKCQIFQKNEWLKGYYHKSSSFLMKFWKILKEFCAETSVHGKIEVSANFDNFADFFHRL
jgi:hypothetical protein